MKQKILITTSNFPLRENDGQSQFMLEYAISLKAHFDVIVLAPKNRNAKNEESWNEIKIYRHEQSPLFNFQLAYGSGIMVNIKTNPLLLFVVPFFILIQAISIRKIVKKEKIDLINAHWIIPQGLSMALLKFTGFKIPYILTVHSGPFWQFEKFPFNIIRNYSLKKANSICCVSKALQDGVAEIAKSKVFHLPLGINVSSFKSLDENQFLIQQLHLKNKKVIVFIGSMIQRKGVTELVQAMKNVVSKIPEAILLMIGEGKLMNLLKHFVLENDLESNVIFTGKIDHYKIPEYLSVSHLLCLPSHMEGFPMVVKEALASEVLVLTTSLPVFQNESELDDIIFYISKVDEIELTNKIIDILNKIDSYEDRKIKGRNYIEENANWTRLADDIKSISENL